MKNPGRSTGGGLVLLLAALVIFGQPVLALNSSANVAIIGGTTLDMSSACGYGNITNANVMWATGGGCLNLNLTALENITFTAMSPSDVNASNLAAFDTAVLNMGSAAMACDSSTLTDQQKADLVAFVGAGNKLIIFDSECVPVNYSWMPYPFNTANPGAMGATGVLTIVEENALSSNNESSPYYINATDLSIKTDAVGDMNVMTTYDPNWCVDMAGTNVYNVTGPVHTYAKYPSGMDVGLFIYNGLDQDYQTISSYNLRQIWVQELLQQFNPSGLPCGITVIGITLSPPNATNYVGDEHTVVATLTDLLGNPQVGVVVNFSVISGPNTGAVGSAITDASGHANFTYAGTGGAGIDQIQACFANGAGQTICSQPAAKEWIGKPGRMTGGGSVFTTEGVRVTHGFELHCDAAMLPNSLQVNWGKGNKFHLESLDAAVCGDNSAITPNPPAAGFDTYMGNGTGRYNGVSGAVAKWTFTDAGEPGKNDIATIQIWDVNNNLVLSVSGSLKSGNQQAHNE